jgi:hypothetical protein
VGKVNLMVKKKKKKVRWKEIPYAPGYWVSSAGEVHNGKIVLKSWVNKGAEYVNLCTPSGKSTKAIHKIMIDSFRGVEEGNVTHLNGDSLDNRLENLERLPVGVHGVVYHPNYGNGDRKVCQLDENGNITKIWDSQIEAADHFGLTNSIYLCCNDPKRTFAGLHWKYADQDLKKSLEWFTVTFKSETYTVCWEGFLISKRGAVTKGSGKNDSYLSYRGQFVHDIIATAFWKKPRDKRHPNQKYEVNHIDGNKHNNNADNLEWVTQSENSKHSFHVLQGGISSQSIPVICIDKKGNETRYISMTDAETKTGVQRLCIRNVCKGIQKESKGLYFRYAEKE